MKSPMKYNDKKLIASILLLLLCCYISMDILGSSNDSYVPKEGYVPNEETAIKIAEAIWLPIYGNEIYRYKPFKARLSMDKKYWQISGTVHALKGGSPYAKIRKSDCKILEVTHYE